MSKRLEMLEQVIAKGSEDPFVHYARAMELRGLGHTEQALSAYADVAERFPDYVPTYLMAAQVAQELGRPAEALRYCDIGLDKARAAGDGHAVSELEAQRAAVQP
jgi:tetratricopeptide (TPR) repeat protein